MPGVGQKVDVETSAADRYADFLTDERQSVLGEAGINDEAVSYTYDVAINGFSADLSAEQVAALRKSDDVVNLFPNETRYADTVSTPDYLGMTGESGVWESQFGGSSNAGEGMIVGVIDTGIAMDNPSFAPMEDAVMPDGIACDFENEPEFECNNKVIGAQYFRASDNIIPSEVFSPTDKNGHGSHTAGTSAGNNGVPMAVSGVDLGTGSGMAPRAQIIAYKALWNTSDDRGTGSSDDLVAAIDAAVADGVDVINYSVSGSRDFVDTPDEVAFFNAANAGIFVATSAGNEGDEIGPSSVAHNSPWTTTVAASTHDRGAAKTITTFDEASGGAGNDTYDGIGLGAAVDLTDFILSVDAPAEGVSAEDAALCLLDTDPATAGNQPSLDPALVDGKVVLCDRGAIARVDKSATVAETGGVGMALGNVSPGQSLDADFHSVPTIHVDSSVRDALIAYEASADDALVEMSAQDDSPVVDPEMAGFSSYGPATAGGGDLLKPDITAPGASIVAAYHNDRTTGDPAFNSISGTSMSAPHIAGLAALMMQQYPDWSPADVKSAMMTTARDVNTAGEPIQRNGVDASPLDYGSGEVVPSDSYNPGLVYEAGAEEWFEYACAIDQPLSNCDGFEDSDPSDVNYPSISIGALAGEQTVTRTVTNVSDQEQVVTASTDAPEGLTVSVSPAELTIPAGETADFEVTVTMNGAPVGEWAFASYVWENDSISVESPIAALPSAISFPEEIFETTTDGSSDFQFTTANDVSAVLGVEGLDPASVGTAPVIRDETTTFDFASRVTVPEGTSVFQISTFNEGVSAADIDLSLINPAGTAIIAASGNGDSTEQVRLLNPEADDYIIAIGLFSEEPTATVDLNVWTVSESADNMTVDPSTVASAALVPNDVTLSWSGLDAGTRYLGAINYELEGANEATTVVTVTPEAALAVERLSGDNRFETAAEIAKSYPAEVDTVYLASGLAFADALSGASPASQSQGTSTMEAAGVAAPILLTEPDELPAATLAAMEEIAPANVIILGGTGSVSQAIEDSLAGDANVVRIGGANRYETSANVAMELYPSGVDTVYIASGESGRFADSLSGGALAGSEGAPVLLTRGDRVEDSTAAALAHLDASNVVVLGGPSSVSDGVYGTVGGSDRLFGDNRYLTAVAITEAYDAEQPHTYLASGDAWPDALAGAGLAGYEGVPMLLTETASVPDPVMAEMDRLSPAGVTILGGTAVVSQGVEDALNVALTAWAE